MGYFIKDVEKATGVSKRQIYNLIRRHEFYKKFSVKSMSSLETKTNKSTKSKLLTQEQYDYLLDKIENGCHFRAGDGYEEVVEQEVYLADLFPGGVFKKGGVEQCRFKLGFTQNKLSKRESEFKVVNPEAKIIRHWKLRSCHEQTLLDYVNGNGCERIKNSEVFVVSDFDKFIAKIEEFAENLK